jgi:hypothetical protein
VLLPLHQTQCSGLTVWNCCVYGDQIHAPAAFITHSIESRVRFLDVWTRRRRNIIITNIAKVKLFL